jgi:hypothetical protein
VVAGGGYEEESRAGISVEKSRGEGKILETCRGQNDTLASQTLEPPL